MAIEEPDAPPAGDAPTTSRFHALVDAWFVEWFHGASAMRDTETFNHVGRAKDDLKRRLAEEN
jgi:hypothetical protein